VVQENAATTNAAYPLTIVAAVSTRGRNLPAHVPVAPSLTNGLEKPSYVKCEHLLTIRKDRLLGRIGELGASEMSDVDMALWGVLGLA
jgi:mRNA-degrading endonuclease toxin of MazEF toxin-antitoxin module